MSERARSTWWCVLLALLWLATGVAAAGPGPQTTESQITRPVDDGGIVPVRPPVAKIVPHTYELHGELRTDNYQWIRESKSDEVLAYLEAENAYTEAQMKPAEGLREKLYEEILNRIQETDLSVPVREGEHFYYSRTEEGKQYPYFCRRKGSLEADEEVLLDVNALAEGHDFYSLGVTSVSPDHKLLAYAFDDSGYETYELVFKDLATGELLADRISPVADSFSWANDRRTVFYTTQDHAQRTDKIFRHVLGTDPATDEEVYHEPDERFAVFVTRTLSDRYLIAGSTSSLTSEMSYLDADRPQGRFRVLRPREHGLEYYVAHHGDHFYIRTNEDAKNFKLVRAPVDDPSPANWEVVIPHRPAVRLEQAILFRHHMVVSERIAGQVRLWVRDLETGEERPIDMPETVYTVFPSDNREFEATVFRFRYTSPVTPMSVFDYDLVSGERTLKKQTEVLGGYDPSQYETRRLFARARDGVAVPVVLVYRKGLERDGTHPCLLYGYGAYGLTIDPYFSSTRLSLLDRGFVYAVANVRGGGVLGEEWHENGRMMHKRNTFTDFIDAAEFLLDQRYTASDRLLIQGGSAGGLLVGAVVNLRPDLFRAVVANVPFVDVVNTMLDESIPLTVGEFEEWGNPKTEEQYRYMMSYSPYDNVTAQDYPRMLITGGLNDSRVHYWEPAKWTAKLRALKTDSNPLMLKMVMEGGHGGYSGRYDRYRELAFVYAFLLDSVGIDSSTDLR